MKTVKIGLFDHMGYGNLGDAATQDAIIANIRKRLSDVEIVGFSLNPEDTRKRHNIASYSITYWHPGLKQMAPPPGTAGRTTLQTRAKSVLKKIPVFSRLARGVLHMFRETRHLIRSFRVLRSLDALIIAGGGQLGDLWRGAWSHPYNVLKFSVLTKVANKKLIILNVGAGPLSSSLSRLFVKCSVQLADYVSLRDRESHALIQKLGVKRAMAVFPDSVYALQLSQRDNRELAGKKPLVGVNPIGFCDPRIWAKHNETMYVRYMDNLTAFCRWLLASGYRLQIYAAEISVDHYACEELKQRLSENMPPSDVDEIFRAPALEVKGLLAQMAQLDFVITSKFHGIIFSHLLAKPVVALSYHNKIDDLMRSAGHGEDCLSIETFDCDRLTRAFLSTQERACKLKKCFRQRTFLNAELLAVQFDELFAPQNLEVGSGLNEGARKYRGGQFELKARGGQDLSKSM